jgi:hypothetical protein
LNLQGPIHPGNWTCFRLGPEGAGQQACLGYLPGDVGADRVSEAADIQALIDHLNGAVPIPVPSCDADRNGECSVRDILRVIDLLNGAGAFDPWLDESLPLCPSG